MIFNLFYIPATLRQLLSGMCTSTHTLLLKQNLGDQVHMLLEGQPVCWSSLAWPRWRGHTLGLSESSHPLFFTMGLLFPRPGEAVRAVPQRKNPEGNGLGPFRACKAGIHLSPSTNGKGGTSRLCASQGGKSEQWHTLWSFQKGTAWKRAAEGWAEDLFQSSIVWDFFLNERIALADWGGNTVSWEDIIKVEVAWLFIRVKV